jgi:hypothetical protein
MALAVALERKWKKLFLGRAHDEIEIVEVFLADEAGIIG